MYELLPQVAQELWKVKVWAIEFTSQKTQDQLWPFTSLSNQIQTQDQLWPFTIPMPVEVEVHTAPHYGPIST